MLDDTKNFNTFDYLIQQGADILSLNSSGKNIYELASFINNN